MKTPNHSNNNTQGAHVALEPAALMAGKIALSSHMMYGGAAVLPPPSAFPESLQEVAVAITSATTGGAIGWGEVLASVLVSSPKDRRDGLRFSIVEISEEPHQHPSNLQPTIDKITGYDRVRREQYLTWQLQDSLGDDAAVARIVGELAKLQSGGSLTLASQLAQRAFAMDNHPPKPIPIFTLCGHPLCTAGNIANIQALPKAGKSAVVESMMASALNGNRQGPDTLGFSATNPEGRALIHFDTEQSQYDHDALVRRAMRRARVEVAPEWLRSYSVADLGVTARRESLRLVMAEAYKANGGIFAVMIDGIGDLALDPNDSEESFALVGELHSLAITYDCAICTVLHENPGSESGKTRGHLGSQLERKAETNLRLAKDKDGVTVIWAERARHCHLPKEQGPCFSWNDAESMHTSCGTAGELRNAGIRDKMFQEADAALGGGSMNYTDLTAAIMDALNIKDRAAKNRIKTWLAEGIIRKDARGIHHLSNS